MLQNIIFEYLEIRYLLGDCLKHEERMKLASVMKYACEQQ